MTGKWIEAHSPSRPLVKVLVLTILTLLVLGLLTPGAFGALSEDVEIPYQADGTTVDGVVSAGEYALAHSMPIHFSRTTLNLGHDGDNIYVAWEVPIAQWYGIGFRANSTFPTFDMQDADERFYMSDTLFDMYGLPNLDPTGKTHPPLILDTEAGGTDDPIEYAVVTGDSGAVFELVYPLHGMTDPYDADLSSGLGPFLMEFAFQTDESPGNNYHVSARNSFAFTLEAWPGYVAPDDGPTGDDGGDDKGILPMVGAGIIIGLVGIAVLVLVIRRR